MDWRWDPAGLAMLGCGAAMLGLAAYVWPRRAAGGIGLVAMLAALAWWSITYGLELSVEPVASKELFGAVKYAGIAVLPPTWIAFTLRYIGRDRVPHQRRADPADDRADSDPGAAGTPGDPRLCAPLPS
jgi:hypothetical protein